MGALWNLAFNDANKKAIAEAGGIPPLVDCVRAGSQNLKEQAAGALANLTVEEDNRVSTAPLQPTARLPIVPPVARSRAL